MVLHSDFVWIFLMLLNNRRLCTASQEGNSTMNLSVNISRDTLFLLKETTSKSKKICFSKSFSIILMYSFLDIFYVWYLFVLSSILNLMNSSFHNKTCYFLLISSLIEKNKTKTTNKGIL